MMSATDTYGDFELPEEKSLVEVVEDPVKTVMSCYEMFIKTVCSKFDNDYYGALLSRFVNYLDYPDSSDLQQGEQIYQNTLKLFEGKEKLNFNFKQLQDLFDGFGEVVDKSGRHFYSPIFGLFISAMHNETLLDEIILYGIYGQLGFGYKLKKNKILVLGPKVEYLGLTGYFSEGVIVNEGKLPKMGLDTISGIQINIGSIGHFADYSKGGIFINNQKSDFIGSCRDKGIYINNGQAYDIASSGDTFAINNGIIKSFANCVDLIKDLITDKKLVDLKQKLDLKLHELDFLKGLNRVDYENQLKMLREFEWKKFEKDITEIAYEIKEADERLK